MQIQTNRKLKHTQGKKKSKKKLIIGMILSFFIFSAIASGVVWWKFEDTLSVITGDTESAIDQDAASSIPANYNQEPISLVIIGRDSRENLGLMNTDVIIVAALNPKTKHVTMMSIPRDTGVKIPGYKSYHKINSVYAKGEADRRSAEKNGEPVTETGTTLLKKTLEEALGIPIHYYAMIDFEGFEKVVDKLGGLEIEVDKSMQYDDPTDGTHINLKQGLQVLDGDHSLDFVRHRMDNRGSKYYSTDFDRGTRQQIVIKAMVDKMKSFTGISSFFSVMNVAGEHIRTDLSKDQIKGLIIDFKSVGSENMMSMESGGYWDRASSHTIIPKEKLEQIQVAFQQEMEIDGGTFHSTLRVDAPREAAPVVVKKAPVKKAAAAPKEEAQEAPKKEEQLTDPEQEQTTPENDDPSANPNTPETNGENGDSPSSEKSGGQEKSSGNQTDVKPSESQAPSQPVEQPKPTTTTEQSGMLQPPVSEK